MAPVEKKWRLAAHTQRAGIDDQIEAALAIVEGKSSSLREVSEVDGVVFAFGGQLVQQSARLVGIAPGEDESEPFPRQRRHDRARRAARAQNARHAKIVLAVQHRSQRLEEPASIGVVAGELRFGRVNRIDRTDSGGRFHHRIEIGLYRLFMRHGHVAAAPIGIGAPFRQIGFEPCGVDTCGTVVRFDTELFQPEAVDGGRFGLGDRIADHFCVRNRHAISAPSSRSASSTGSSGMPRIVN